MVLSFHRRLIPAAGTARPGSRYPAASVGPRAVSQQLAGYAQMLMASENRWWRAPSAFPISHPIFPLRSPRYPVLMRRICARNRVSPSPSSHDKPHTASQPIVESSANAEPPREPLARADWELCAFATLHHHWECHSPFPTAVLSPSSLPPSATTDTNLAAHPDLIGRSCKTHRCG